MTTTEETAIRPVHKSVTVKASAERAFRIFTEGVDTWWPRAHHIGKSPMKKAVIEGRAGGRCFTEQIDGTDCDWGQVLVWEPPHRLVMAWQVTPAWDYEPDVAKSSEVVVRFTPELDGSTRVDLEHRHLERHGAGWAPCARRSIRPMVGTERCNCFKRAWRGKHSARLTYRIAAAVFVLFAVGHTLGFLTFKPPTAEAAAVREAMDRAQFLGAHSFGRFYVGLCGVGIGEPGRDGAASGGADCVELLRASIGGRRAGGNIHRRPAGRLLRPDGDLPGLGSLANRSATGR